MERPSTRPRGTGPAPALLSFLLLAGLASPGSPPLAAQEPPASDPAVVVPGDGTLRMDRLRPFEAEYEQLGTLFLARLARTGGEEPVWSFQMIMDGPEGGAVDQVGHRTGDLAFAFRRFGFGAFRNEYVEATAGDSVLTVRRMARDSASTPVPGPTAVPLDGPVFDGTTLYWWMGLLPLGGEGAWRFRTWTLTPDAATTRASGAVRVAERDTVSSADGRRWPAWTLVAATPQGELRSWVTEEPPYLLRQEMVSPDGTVTPVIELIRVRAP